MADRTEESLIEKELARKRDYYYRNKERISQQRKNKHEPNPIKEEKIRCYVNTCKENGICFIQSKCFCRTHRKELKDIEKKFGIRLIPRT